MDSEGSNSTAVDSIPYCQPLPWMEWGYFENFGKTQIRAKVLLARPKNLEEVQATIRYARRCNLRVRAGGKCHSWSPLFSDEGQIVLFTRDIEGDGERIRINEDRTEVTIMTGVNTGELKKFLLEEKLTIRSNVILQVVEMGGVIGSICHGVGNTERTVSDYMVAMRVVNSDAELVTYDFRGAEWGTDKTNAIKGHLGLFGIVYDMTLRVDEEVVVDVKNTWNTVQEVFYDEGNLKKLLDNNWSVELFWFPYNGMSSAHVAEVLFSGKLADEQWDPFKDKVWGRIINPSARPSEISPEPADMPIPIECRTIWRPACTPALLKTVCKFLSWIYTPDVVRTWPLMTAIHYQPASYMAHLVPSLDLEVAIDAGANYENVKTAVTHFYQLLKEYGQRGEFPVNIALEMRLVSKSDILLAPAQAGRPYTMYIEVLSIQNTAPWDRFLRDLTAQWKTISGCRFHWAKQWRVLGGDIDDFVRQSYGENIEKFKTELEKSGADPERMFSKEMLDAILWPQERRRNFGTGSDVEKARVGVT